MPNSRVYLAGGKWHAPPSLKNQKTTCPTNIKSIQILSVQNTFNGHMKYSVIINEILRN